jgi:Replication-relaxation
MSNNHEHNCGLAIQERDTRMFFGLLESRVMTREQLAALYFAGSYDAARKRLARLTGSGFVLERKPVANPGHFFPSTLYLGRKGFDTLRSSPHLDSFPDMTWEHLVERVSLARSTLAHELELIDHKVAFSTALGMHPTCTLVEFLTWPALFQFKTTDLETGDPLLLKPDASIVVGEPDEREHHFFVEYDRSKEAGRQLMKKAWGYHRYYASGGFGVRHGAQRDAFKEHPFRVLYVLPTEERRNAIAERLLQVYRPDDRGSKKPVLLKNQHWLTTSAEFLADPLGPIWLTLREYWRATAGTIYDPREHVTTHRVSARDRLVAATAELGALFAHETKEVSHG